MICLEARDLPGGQAGESLHSRTLSYALLGLLARRPLWGYELARRMKEPIGYFWHAHHSQIYPELAALESQGFVTHEVVQQQDRPDKKLYSITEAGRVTLQRWVIEVELGSPSRDELMVKAFSVWLADRNAASALYRAHEREHLRQLAIYETQQAQLEERHGADAQRVDSPAFASYATLRHGIEYERGYAQWCGWMAGALERAPRGKAHDEEPPG
jgi:DNA-binding PadR family transcriptional regulator